MTNCQEFEKELQNTLYDHLNSAPDINIEQSFLVLEHCPYVAFHRLINNVPHQNTWKLWNSNFGPRYGMNLFYDFVFDVNNPPGCFLDRIMDSFTSRWSKLFPVNIDILKRSVVQHVIPNLRYISKQLPPRIHNACVRFVLNGFHTASRYQQTRTCLFCLGDDSTDSIEHFTECPFLLNRLPQFFRQQTKITRNRHFFLLTGKQDSTLLFAMFIAATYTLHNTLRNDPGRHELKQLFQRSHHDSWLNSQCRKLWEQCIV